MWVNPRENNEILYFKRQLALHSKNCGGEIEASETSISQCQMCRERDRLILLFCRDCGFIKKICVKCYEQNFGRERTKQSGTDKRNENLVSDTSNWGLTYLIPVIGIIIIVGYLLASSVLYKKSLDASNYFQQLKDTYPLQKKETWYHVLSVLETENPTVKTIILLHGEDRRTTDCLVRHLVLLFSNDKNLRTEDVTYRGLNRKIQDYGEVLEYYRPIIRKNRILITDLNKMSGNIARVFHSLCDEQSSDIKPSLFIFTLQYDDSTTHLKPLQRANNILMESWNDLAENEIFPLLSRIVKNVVDVIPEEDTRCTL